MSQKQKHRRDASVSRVFSIASRQFQVVRTRLKHLAPVAAFERNRAIHGGARPAAATAATNILRVNANHFAAKVSGINTVG